MNKITAVIAFLLKSNKIVPDINSNFSRATNLLIKLVTPSSSGAYYIYYQEEECDSVSDCVKEIKSSNKELLNKSKDRVDNFLK
jgi:Asp/Glu/hydantoin racemase